MVTNVTDTQPSASAEFPDELSPLSRARTTTESEGRELTELPNGWASVPLRTAALGLSTLVGSERDPVAQLGLGSPSTALPETRQRLRRQASHGGRDAMDGIGPSSSLHKEVAGFLQFREKSLLKAIQTAIQHAPDVDRELAALALEEARRRQLSRLSLDPDLGISLQLHDPTFSGRYEPRPSLLSSPQRSWETALTRVTLGAKLELGFLVALRNTLEPERIPSLEIVAREDPIASTLLWADALKDQEGVRRTVFAITDACTRLVRDRHAVTSHLTHDAMLGLFAAIFEALPDILTGHNGAHLTTGGT